MIKKTLLIFGIVAVVITTAAIATKTAPGTAKRDQLEHLPAEILNNAINPAMDDFGCTTDADCVAKYGEEPENDTNN